MSDAVAAAPTPGHELLLGLAGWVDDDLLAIGRELVAVGEEAGALELLTASLAADRTVLPHPVRAALADAVERRIGGDLAPLVPPGAPLPDRTAHVFAPDAGDRAAGERIREIVAGLTAVPRSGARMSVTWRLTPAGAAPGPLPHPVVLLVLDDPAPAEVLAYQVGAALARAGLAASVEAFAEDAVLPPYHRAALAAAATPARIAGTPTAGTPATGTPAPGPDRADAEEPDPTRMTAGDLPYVATPTSATVTGPYDRATRSTGENPDPVAPDHRTAPDDPSWSGPYAAVPTVEAPRSAGPARTVGRANGDRAGDTRNGAEPTVPASGAASAGLDADRSRGDRNASGAPDGNTSTGTVDHVRSTTSGVEAGPTSSTDGDGLPAPAGPGQAPSDDRTGQALSDDRTGQTSAGDSAEQAPSDDRTVSPPAADGPGPEPSTDGTRTASTTGDSGRPGAPDRNGSTPRAGSTEPPSSPESTGRTPTANGTGAPSSAENTGRAVSAEDTGRATSVQGAGPAAPTGSNGSATPAASTRPAHADGSHASAARGEETGSASPAESTGSADSGGSTGSSSSAGDGGAAPPVGDTGPAAPGPAASGPGPHPTSPPAGATASPASQAPGPGVTGVDPARFDPARNAVDRTVHGGSGVPGRPEIGAEPVDGRADTPANGSTPPAGDPPENPVGPASGHPSARPGHAPGPDAPAGTNGHPSPRPTPRRSPRPEPQARAAHPTAASGSSANGHPTPGAGTDRSAGGEQEWSRQWSDGSWSMPSGQAPEPDQQVEPATSPTPTTPPLSRVPPSPTRRASEPHGQPSEPAPDGSADPRPRHRNDTQGPVPSDSGGHRRDDVLDSRLTPNEQELLRRLQQELAARERGSADPPSSPRNGAPHTPEQG